MVVWLNKHPFRTVEVTSHTSGVRITLRENYQEISCACDEFPFALEKALIQKEVGMIRLKERFIEAATIEVEEAKKNLEDKLNRLEQAKKSLDKVFEKI